MVPVFEHGAKQTLDHENVHLEEKSFALVILFPENGSKVPGNFQKYKVGEPSRWLSVRLKKKKELATKSEILNSISGVHIVGENQVCRLFPDLHLRAVLCSHTQNKMQ